MRVAFSEFLFDREARQLSAEGSPIHLSQRAFRMLELLLSSAPSAVPKDEIYRTLWGTTFVEEANIPNLVSELRTALGDSRGRHRFITTVHRFGYRFDGVIRSEAPGNLTVRHALIWGEREFLLPSGDHVIGRDAEANVTIESQGISRRHARLTIDGEIMTLEDLGSKNGTFVRGDRIHSIVTLNDGESVRLGSVWLTVRRIDPDSSTKTEAVE